MAGISEAKRSFWTLIDSWKAKKSATLILKSVNGELKARLEINLGHHEHDQAKLKRKRTNKSCPSQQRRKERRAADPAVKARAAARLVVAAEEEVAPLPTKEAAMPSPEKVRSSCVLKSLKTSPVKDDTREEVVEGRAHVPQCQQLCEHQAPSPEKEAIKEDLFEGVVEKPPFLEVPHDFGDRANNDYEHDFEKTKQAEKILSEDRCCFCDYECPPPTQQENGDRFLGILQHCWDHVEEYHPLAYEWLA